MKKTTLVLLALTLALLSAAQVDFGIPKIKQIEYQPENKLWFARYGQFQFEFEYTVENTSFGLPQVKDQELQVEKIKKYLEMALAMKINVAIFPELSISLKEAERKNLINYLEEFSYKNDMIIIAGTFYDNLGKCKNATVLPTGTIYTYKIRPSIFESSTLGGNGMSFSDTLHLFNTKYGNFLTLVCVDLISDDANYKVRDLSNKGLLDILININFNPKSQEFMREASAIAARHPLFVSITNVINNKDAIDKFTWDKNEYGNTSIFGIVRRDFKEEIAESLPSFYCENDTNNKKP
ncbi:MAG: hypothetical protein GY834_08780, partial [Bacteroidetes bacterium]|nr:hypothetical protein [Bacteroidota bacterium]